MMLARGRARNREKSHADRSGIKVASSTPASIEPHPNKDK